MAILFGVIEICLFVYLYTFINLILCISLD